MTDQYRVFAKTSRWNTSRPSDFGYIYDKGSRTGTDKDFNLSHVATIFTFGEAVFWQAYLEVFFKYDVEVEKILTFKIANNEN